MKAIYPTIITKTDNGTYSTFVPGLEINSQGETMVDAISMTRDAIGEIICFRQDENIAIAKPVDIGSIEHNANEIVTLIDVDINEYRRKVDNRMERTNVTIPSWLKFQAENAGINFSQTLQKALREELHIID